MIAHSLPSQPFRPAKPLKLKIFTAFSQIAVMFSAIAEGLHLSRLYTELTNSGVPPHDAARKVFERIKK